MWWEEDEKSDFLLSLWSAGSLSNNDFWSQKISTSVDWSYFTFHCIQSRSMSLTPNLVSSSYLTFLGDISSKDCGVCWFNWWSLWLQTNYWSRATDVERPQLASYPCHPNNVVAALRPTSYRRNKRARRHHSQLRLCSLDWRQISTKASSYRAGSYNLLPTALWLTDFLASWSCYPWHPALEVPAKRHCCFCDLPHFGCMRHHIYFWLPIFANWGSMSFNLSYIFCSDSFFTVC